MRKSNLLYQSYRSAKQETEQRLVGLPLRRHLIKNICRIMTEYAPLVAVTSKEIADDIKAIKAWKLDEVTDWYFLYDAIASSACLDVELLDFCSYARARWRYSQLSRFPLRTKK